MSRSARFVPRDYTQEPALFGRDLNLQWNAAGSLEGWETWRRSAAYLQHLAVIEVRKVLEERKLTVGAKAEELGAQPSYLRRKLTGELPMTLEDYIEWSTAIGRSLLLPGRLSLEDLSTASTAVSATTSWTEAKATTSSTATRATTGSTEDQATTGSGVVSTMTNFTAGLVKTPSMVARTRTPTLSSTTATRAVSPQGTAGPNPAKGDHPPPQSNHTATAAPLGSRPGMHSPSTPTALSASGHTAST